MTIFCLDLEVLIEFLNCEGVQRLLRRSSRKTIEWKEKSVLDENYVL